MDRPSLQALALAPRALLYRGARAIRIAELFASQVVSAASATDEAVAATISRRAGRLRAAGRRAAIFCHFDANGEVNGSAKHLLAGLAEAGLDVVAVSNSPSLSAQGADALAEHSMIVLHRRNVGYDFGAYRDGLAALGDLSGYQSILLVNDSVIGPFAPLAPLLSRLNDSADVWGLTDSRERGWHLQSYFLAFSQRALGHPAFSSFWQNYRTIGSKDWAVHAGELALSRTLTRGGLRLRALFPFEQIRNAFIAQAKAEGHTPRFAGRGAARDVDHVLAASVCKLPFNPTHLYWDTLVEAFDSPFVKRDLAETNPARLISAGRISDTVDARFGAGAWARASGKGETSVG